MKNQLDLLMEKFELLKNKQKSKDLWRFFKTWKWEYWQWDVFLWITVPEQRKLVGEFVFLEKEQLQVLLNSKYHEHRLTALLILVNQYQKWDDKTKKEIYDFYLANRKGINNWDLVDATCPKIVWDYLFFHKKEKGILDRFVKSKNLWERRITVLSCFTFIKNKDLDDCFRFAEILLKDKHDLIHKAVWWMLREAWKVDQERLEKFLDKYVKKMPRTMLRYSIEKFEEEKRKGYLRR